MPVSESQKQLVQDSWEAVLPIAQTAVGMFYERLFETHPELRSLFPEDLSTQRGKLAKALNLAVRGLDDPSRLVPVLEEMGARHVGYGVEESHYDAVGASLLWTLEQGLGDAWNEDLADAWGAVYGVVAGVMVQGARAAV